MQMIMVGTRLRGGDLAPFLSQLPRDAVALDALKPDGLYQLQANHFGLASLKVRETKGASFVTASGPVMNMFLLYSAIRELNRLYLGSEGLECLADGKPIGFDLLGRSLYGASLEEARTARRRG